MRYNVSIITPCLNSEKTIRDTIESVLAQAYPGIEYIIVDGGSTDGTLDIIKEYEPRFDGRMRYISEKDNGIYNAMNKGIRMSHGRVIGILNSDDYYEKDAVERVMDYSWSGGPQVVYGYLRMLSRSGSERVWIEPHENLLQRMLPHPTCFVSRAAYEKHGLFLEWFKIAADYELMLRFYRAGVPFTMLPCILTNFRMGGASHGKRLDMESAIARAMHGACSAGELAQGILGYVLS